MACSNLHAQNIQDFKTKNSANQKERTAMLDLLRAKMKKSLKIECSYVVEHFKVSSNYAWMKGTAQRKDGKPLELNPDLDLDCCMVTCLFKKYMVLGKLKKKGILAQMFGMKELEIDIQMHNREYFLLMKYTIMGIKFLYTHFGLCKKS